jgi:hypothetical protein
MDSKGFYGFKRRYVKQEEVCPDCGKDFNAVDLKKSDSKHLHVCCDGWKEGCECFTIANRRITAVRTDQPEFVIENGFQAV